MSLADVRTVAGRTAVLQQVDAATDLLLHSAGSLSEGQLRGPSRLPGWTRAHVLAHLARNGEAMANLLRGARTGTPATAYLSQEARDAAIEEGATRPLTVLLPELIDAAGLFRAEGFDVPDTAWDRPVRILASAEFPAAEVLVRRLVEIELHHVDLGVGYDWRDWPETFARFDLPEPMHTWRADRMR
jgi:maleylpyruvate isomerase